MVERKVFFEGSFGKIFGVLHLVENSKEIVIVVHGFSSTKDTGAIQISQELNKVGLSAIRIDLDNQGEFELDFKEGVSIPNYVTQVEATIKYCKDLGFNEISLVGGFELGDDLSMITKNCSNTKLFFSKDDDCVPISHLEKYKQKLQDAEYFVYEDKGHFAVEEFSELIKIIKEDLVK